MNQEEKRIMGLTVSAHALIHIYEGILPPLIPLLIAEFGTDYFHLGVVVTVFSYAYGFGSLPSGFLSDRFGPRRLVTLFLFGAGLFCVFIWPIGNLLIYGVLMGVIGLFCSTYHPASNTLISHAIREKGRGFGIHGIAGSLGTAVIPALSAWIGAIMGWKVPYVLFGFMGIGAGFYSLTISRESVIAREQTRTKEPEIGLTRKVYLNLIFFYLSAMGLGLSYRGIMTFLPVYLGQNVHMSFLKIDTVALGGTLAAVALLSGAAGQYLSGRLVDYFKPEALYLGAVGLLTVMVFLMARGSDLLLVIIAILYAFLYFSTQPIQNYLISGYLPRHRQGLGFGIHFFLVFGVGSTAAAVSGYVADRFGLAYVFYISAICLIVSTFLVFSLLLSSSPRRKEARDMGYGSIKAR